MSATAIGIDIGKTGLHLCLADPSQPNPHKWPVQRLLYADSNWYLHLATAIGQGAFVVAEPTGWHYLAPVVSVLQGWCKDATLHLVNHRVTGDVRRLHVHSAKSDETDAQALALIAQLVARGQAPLGVRPYLHTHETSAQTLRLHVNAHVRLTKAATRFSNQLDALAHALWPELAISKATWLRCIDFGAVTPADILELAADFSSFPELRDGRKSRPISQLAAKLPHVEGDPAVISAVHHLRSQMRHVEDEIAANLHIIQLMVERPPFDKVTFRWYTVPGLSALDAATLHVATRGQAQFYTPAQFCTAVGVAPKSQSSGSSTITHRTRQGYRPALNALHLLCLRLLSAKFPDNPIRRYFQARQHKQRPMSAARRKLGSILSGIARNEKGEWRP